MTAKRDIRSKSESNPRGLRLNKLLAHAGLASRRAADAMIQAGRVRVNGALVTEPGTRVDPATDSVTVDGTPLALTDSKQNTYLILNKPVQVVSTVKDPQGRKTVLDLLPPEYARKRLYPVGRLDYFSEGLLLLTDDGEMTLRLTHPRHHLPKTYRVTLRERPTPEMLDVMQKGMTLSEGETLAPLEASLLRGRENVLEIVLRQGVNRQIRRMCRDLNLTILRLVRVSIGPLRLEGLAPGSARELTPEELAALRHCTGLPGK